LDLGHREDALAAIREAAAAGKGHREDALVAIREAVELYRQLTKGRPAAFNPDLANSLHNLSSCLSDLGHREDALATIREAAELYRQLANDRPAAFDPDLVISLNNLSIHPKDMGHREDTLAAVREAVELYRQLTKDRPAIFNSDLANSLRGLSNRLRDTKKTLWWLDRRQTHLILPEISTPAKHRDLFRLYLYHLYLDLYLIAPILLRIHLYSLYSSLDATALSYQINRLHVYCRSPRSRCGHPDAERVSKPAILRLIKARVIEPVMISMPNRV